MFTMLIWVIQYCESNPGGCSELEPTKSNIGFTMLQYGSLVLGYAL